MGLGLGLGPRHTGSFEVRVRVRGEGEGSGLGLSLGSEATERPDESPDWRDATETAAPGSCLPTYGSLMYLCTGVGNS